MTQASVRRAVSSRGFFLLPVGAFVVHQLRYTLAYGSRADQVMAAQGHSYVDSLAPWLVLLLGLGLGVYLLRVARARGGRASARPVRSFVELWALASMSLAAIYVVQEFLEGFFAVGHPGGVGGILGHGGWWALPIAVVVGAALAGLLRLAEAIVAVASRRSEPRFLNSPASSPDRPRVAQRSSRPPLADRAAGRAPPLGLAVASTA